MSQTPPIISDLIKKFERNLHEYRNPKYNETLIRIEFVNPFWKALGWDVDNEKGYALSYRDVIHEDELKVGRSTRAPDYAFRIGGRRIFFLETKKPAVDLKHDPAAAFQLRRYAYSAKLPVSLLTDFEELIVYDCRLKPAITDKPHIGRMMYYTFQEYIEKWQEISSIFSKEAVMQGAFDRFIEDTQGKRPRAEIDRDFLNDLDKWRIELARNIALRNPELTERELNYAVQLTIDRLIFLRMCEDRDIEQYETLMTLLNGNQVYHRLVKLYYKADHRYNSGLFHFEEKDGPNPDLLTPKLEVDDKILKQIISELYYPKCPYEFSVLPVEVLGNAYEQFLGKRITLTEGHRARIEEKPEVRKAGGVYYTPQYIVDYIVKNTVGKLCEGKTPREISELRILDPACGSGSFLLGAYQYLLDWHVNWYRAEYERTGDVSQIAPVVVVDKIHSGDVVEKIHEFSLQRGQQGQRGRRQGRPPKTKRKPTTQAIFQGKGGEWFLTTAEKKRILINNIFGVDIDANAVEVTKLSLLLKVLEHETSETLNQQLGLWKERALPNLESNIKCGNSLIGTDFYEGRQTGFFNEEEALRINAFDWEREFPEIFAKGGFDAVIGNPPYGYLFGGEELSYLVSKFFVFSKINDAYIAFIETAHNILLSTEGLFGFIIPSAWLGGPNYLILREKLLQVYISQVISLPFDVFKDAYVDTLLLLTRNSKPNEKDLVSAYNFPKKEKIKSIDLNERPISIFHQDRWADADDKKFVLEFDVLKLLSSIKKKIPTSGSDLFQIKRGVLFDRKQLTLDKTSDNSHLYFEGDVYRYTLNYRASKWIEYGSKMREYPKEFFWFEGSRILLRRLVNRQKRLMASYAEKTFITNKNLYIVKPLSKISMYYILGLLNSKLVSRMYLATVSQATKDDFPQVTQKDILNIPFPLCDLSNPPAKEKHDQLVLLVEQILDLNKKHVESKDKHSRELFQRQINATDRQIDQLVYQLYGLTEEEIRIVEGAK